MNTPITIGPRRCKVCLEGKSITDFYRSRPDGYYVYTCKVCVCRINAEARAARYSKDELDALQALYNSRRPADQRRATWLRSRYGMEIRDCEALSAAQGGACAICQVPLDAVHSPTSPSSPVIDHNHLSHAVRGILCRKCNSGIGLFRDDPTFLRAAAQYIENDGVALAVENQWMPYRRKRRNLKTQGEVA